MEAERASLGIAQRIPKGFGDVEIKVYEFVVNNPSATIARIAQELGVAERTVKNHLAKLKKCGKISRVGGKTHGHWEVMSDPGGAV